MSELVRLDGKHTAQTAHFAVLKKSSRHPWPHGRGILLFSTHLLATARWAWAPPCSWWWGRLRWWRLHPWCLLKGLTTWRRCVSALQGTPPHLSGSACLDGNWENLHLFLVCSPSPILLSFYPYTSKPSCSSKHLLQNWLYCWGSVGATCKQNTRTHLRAFP